MLPQEPYKRFAVITLYSAVAIAIVYLFFNYLWGALLPFVVAYLFAECFRPIVKYSETHKSFPRKSFVLFVILLAAFAISLLVFAITRRLFLELRELTIKATDMLTLIRSDDIYAEEIIEKINGLVPFVDIRDRLWEMRQNLDIELWSALVSIGENMSGSLFSAVGTAASFLPNALFTFAVLIIATYYFAIDRVKIHCFFLSLFPKNLRPKLKSARDTLAQSVGQYLRAYGILFLITFAELLIAFWILGVNYSFVLALVISIVDVLPVLGTGTVLVPWGIGALFLSDYRIGLGVLITYAVILVVRQIIEPKIVGKFIGLSPLGALASMYVGLKLVGIVGIFVFPLAAILIKRLLSASEQKTTE